MLDRHPNPDRRDRLLRGMQQAVERGAGLTRQLLAFSRRQPLQAEPVDLVRQINGMREMLDRSLRGDIKVSLRLPDTLWVVEVDPGELELVLLNLAVNARDAMPAGGTIEIRAENVPNTVEDGLKGDFVSLSVIDSGTGMTDEVKARVFEPFFTTKDVGKGSGLGLAQAYGFARQSGGSVQIFSELGKGTTVRLMLPRCRKAVPVAARTDGSPVAKAGASAHVLLVEDDDEVAALVGEMMAQLGFEATRGRQPCRGAGRPGRWPAHRRGVLRHHDARRHELRGTRACDPRAAFRAAHRADHRIYGTGSAGGGKRWHSGAAQALSGRGPGLDPARGIGEPGFRVSRARRGPPPPYCACAFRNWSMRARAVLPSSLSRLNWYSWGSCGW